MKPSNIHKILDLALLARKRGHIFNPLFTGEAGLGKSFITQQWVQVQRKRNPKFLFLDLRIAYMEAPDMIGFPKEVQDENGKWRTVHCLPEIWPTDPDAEGLILLEEPNRGTPGVMNCLMQILTDRKIHLHELPKGIIVAGCINPDSAEYDVNHMDAALKNRFEEFEIEFDHLGFSDYIETAKWHDDIIRFVSSGTWLYKKTSEIKEGGQYISPRTWEKVHAALAADIKNNRMEHRMVIRAVLGKDIGNEFHKFSYDQAPVTAQDLLKGKNAALKRLLKMSEKDHYKGDMIASTVDSIVKNYGGLKADCKPDQVCEDVMAEVAKIIPADQAVNLLKQCGFKQSKGQVIQFFRDFVKRHPELVDTLRDHIKISRATT